MCENLYYTIDEHDDNVVEEVMNHDFILNAGYTTRSKNKIIEHQELEEDIEIKLINYSYLTLKQLYLICDYYGITAYIRIAKCNKEDIVNMLVLYENTDENYEIVVKRKKMWKYLAELKNDKFMKKFIIN